MSEEKRELTRREKKAIKKIDSLLKEAGRELHFLKFPGEHPSRQYFSYIAHSLLGTLGRGYFGERTEEKEDTDEPENPKPKLELL